MRAHLVRIPSCYISFCASVASSFGASIASPSLKAPCEGALCNSLDDVEMLQLAHSHQLGDLKGDEEKMTKEEEAPQQEDNSSKVAENITEETDEAAQVLFRRYAAQAVEGQAWPDCVMNGTRVKSSDEDLFADLTDYGATGGCAAGDCTDSDEMSADDPAVCASICRALTNCNYWSWGSEASELKCWFRWGNSAMSTIPAEAAGFVTGSVRCAPELTLSEALQPTSHVVSVLGPPCSNGNGPNGRFASLGMTRYSQGTKYFYYSPTATTHGQDSSAKFLYYDENCNGGVGTSRWGPHWIMGPNAPNVSRENDLDGDKDCDAQAYSGYEGAHGIPSSAIWQVDCNNDGVDRTSAALVILKHGLEAKFWTVTDRSMNAFGRKEFMRPADHARIDPRVDYWTTTMTWDGLPEDQDWTSYLAQWSGYLYVDLAGDYQFAIGSSDGARLMWYHQPSGTWAVHSQWDEQQFNYGPTDADAETKRSLTQGFHRFKIEFFQKSKAAGMVFKYKGQDSQNVWKVVPSTAFLVHLPECVVDPAYPICKEGLVIPAGGNCTVRICDEGEVSEPAVVQCTTKGVRSTFGKFRCVRETTTTTTTTTTSSTTTTVIVDLGIVSGTMMLGVDDPHVFVATEKKLTASALREGIADVAGVRLQDVKLSVAISKDTESAVDVSYTITIRSVGQGGRSPADVAAMIEKVALPTISQKVVNALSQMEAAPARSVVGISAVPSTYTQVEVPKDVTPNETETGTASLAAASEAGADVHVGQQKAEVVDEDELAMRAQMDEEDVERRDREAAAYAARAQARAAVAQDGAAYNPPVAEFRPEVADSAPVADTPSDGQATSQSVALEVVPQKSDAELMADAAADDVISAASAALEAHGVSSKAANRADELTQTAVDGGGATLAMAEEMAKAIESGVGEASSAPKAGEPGSKRAALLQGALGSHVGRREASHSGYAAPKEVAFGDRALDAEALAEEAALQVLQAAPRTSSMMSDGDASRRAEEAVAQVLQEASSQLMPKAKQFDRSTKDGAMEEAEQWAEEAMKKAEAEAEATAT